MIVDDMQHCRGLRSTPSTLRASKVVTVRLQLKRKWARKWASNGKIAKCRLFSTIVGGAVSLMRTGLYTMQCRL